MERPSARGPILVGSRTVARIFVSHAGVDEPAARRIADALREAGHEPWLAEDEIPTGARIPTAIAQALEDCAFAVVCLSRAAVASGWVKHELDLAVMRQFGRDETRVLPIRLEDVDPPAVVAHIKYDDLFPGKQGFQDGVARLVRSIALHEGQPAPPQRAPARAMEASAEDYRRAVAEQHGFLLTPAGAIPIGEAYIDISLWEDAKAAASARPAEERESRNDAPRVSLEQQLLGSRRSALILADPGAGKTTLLRYLAWKTATTDVFGTPLYVHLGRWPLRGGSPAGVIEAAVDDAAGGASSAEAQRPLLDALESVISRDGALLLVDGIDEAPADALRPMIECLVALRRRVGRRLRLVVASRPTGDLQALSSLSLGAPLRLCGLDGVQRSAIVRQRLEKLGRAEGAHDLLRRLQRDSDLRWLSRNPLLLQLMVRLHT